MRKRRSAPDPLVQPERRYVQADRSQRGQTRYYVQLRNGLPKIRIKAEFGTKEFDEECDAAIADRALRRRVRLHQRAKAAQRTARRTSQ